MSVLSAVLGGSAAPHTVEWKGRQLSVGHLDQNRKVAFEKALLRRDRETVKEFKDLYTEEEYKAKLEAMMADFTLGKYSFGSPFCNSYLNSGPGILLITSLLLDITEMETISLLAEQGAEVTALVKLSLAESGLLVPKLQEGEEADPNSKAS